MVEAVGQLPIGRQPNGDVIPEGSYAEAVGKTLDVTDPMGQVIGHAVILDANGRVSLTVDQSPAAKLQRDLAVLERRLRRLIGKNTRDGQKRKGHEPTPEQVALAQAIVGSHNVWDRIIKDLTTLKLTAAQVAGEYRALRP